MGFKKHPGIQGKIYVPDLFPERTRKHACKDCFFCQFCSDDRCLSCLGPESDRTTGRLRCRCESRKYREESGR